MVDVGLYIMARQVVNVPPFSTSQALDLVSVWTYVLAVNTAEKGV
jgi:hypothetical protein